MHRAKLSVLFGVLAVTAVSADNWPQWRGPQLNGTAADKGLPVKWGPTENIAWKLAMPSRTGATPIVWNDRIFLNVATEDKGGAVELWSVDRASGNVQWKRPITAGNYRINKQNMSSPSPVTDGTNVWVLTGLGILKAFDFAGKELWTRDIQKDYGTFGLNWGYGSSPLLHQDALYVQVFHGMKTDDPSYLMKLDKKTGKTLWKTERPTKAIQESPDAYTTPALLQHGNTTEIVTTGGDTVTGHDPASGKELWRVEGLNPDRDPFYRIIASPLVAGRAGHRPDARAPDAGDSTRGTRQRHEHARRLELRTRTGRADAGQRWDAPLHRRRPGHRPRAGHQDRRGRLRSRAAQAGDLQRLSHARRRQDLRDQ